jgi:quinol-cytochrome oxidoreductase complex cytochrome b subunit
VLAPVLARYTLVPAHMSTANRDGGTERSPLPRWLWLDLGAFAWGLLLIVLAFTDHNRGSASDPAGIFHKYTLYHDVGPAIVPFVALPAIVSLALLPLLYLKSTRSSQAVDRAAWVLVVATCVAAFAGLIVEGIVVVPAAVLIVWATAAAPLGAQSLVR